MGNMPTTIPAIEKILLALWQDPLYRVFMFWIAVMIIVLLSAGLFYSLLSDKTKGSGREK